MNPQREMYDPLSQKYSEAHISVTQPLLRELDKREWDHLQDQIAQFTPFPINFGPLNSFLPYPCIWYEIRSQDQILKIREVLHQTGFFNLHMKHPENFIPHMTITEGLSGPTVYEMLLEKIQNESATGFFRCKELVLNVPDEEFQFNVDRRIPLGIPA